MATKARINPRKLLVYILSKIKMTSLLVTLLIIASFLIGVLYTKVSYLEKNVSGNNSVIAQDLDPQVPQQPTGPIEVSVDDDPVLGKDNAPVTMIEFVDYECPFCKRFFDETLSQIKSK